MKPYESFVNGVLNASILEVPIPINPSNIILSKSSKKVLSLTYF